MLGLGASLSRGYAPAAGFVNTHSLSLDGGGGNLFDTNYQTDSTFQGSFTFSMWIKPTDGQGASQNLANINDVVTGSQITIALGTLGILSFFHAVNGDLAIANTVTAIVPDGPSPDFVHIAIVVTKNTGADTTYTFYSDGALRTSSTILEVSDVNHALFSSSNDLTIGLVTANYEGLIDEFGLWNEALDAANIAAIYNDGAPIDLTQDSGNYTSSSNIVLNYKFDNSTEDAAGTSDGTLVGTATYSTDNAG